MTKADYDPTTYGDSIADDYDDMYEHVYDTDSAVAFVADLAQGGSVLELGIGTGRLALPLAQRGVEVHGVDASPAMLDKLRTKPGADKIEVTTGDFATVQLRRGTSRWSCSRSTRSLRYPTKTPRSPSSRTQPATSHRAADSSSRLGFPTWVVSDEAKGYGRATSATTSSPSKSARCDAVHQRMETTQIRFGPDGPSCTRPTIGTRWPAELDLMGRLAGMRLCAVAGLESHAVHHREPDARLRLRATRFAGSCRDLAEPSSKRGDALGERWRLSAG